MDSVKKCAYCGAVGNLTREHIWPDGIMKKINCDVRYTLKADKVFSGDMTVKDVCQKCNNGPLSIHDSYFCSLYDKYFSHAPKPFKSVNFEYDFSKLMLSLLKISFNATRPMQLDTDVLSKYKTVLISTDPVSPIQVIAYVGVVKPSKIKNPNSKPYMLYAKLGRCGPMIITNVDYDHWCRVRTIIINGYWFTLILPYEPLVKRADFSLLAKEIYGVPLHPGGHVKIPSPKKSALDVYDGVENWPKK